MRPRFFFAILLLGLMGNNLLLPSACAAHCASMKIGDIHRGMGAEAGSQKISCADCYSDLAQIHVFACANSFQMDARIESMFNLASARVAEFVAYRPSLHSGTPLLDGRHYPKLRDSWPPSGNPSIALDALRI
jgi:hypothetical protein